MAEQETSLQEGKTKQSTQTKTQPLIPKLRFKEFDGEWEKKKAGELCDCIVPGRNKPKIFDGNIAWITTPDIIHNSYITNSKINLGISKEEAKSVGSKIVPKNSVIISCVGDLGLVAIAGVELVINQQLHAFLPSKRVEYRFLMYSISTQEKYIDRVATKTAVPYMNKSNCNSIPVYIPSLPEQQKIASFLSAVDEKIQQLTQKKSLLEQYKKGVMQQLFSGELRFKEFTNEFEENRLSQFLVRHSNNNKDGEFGINDILSLSSKYGIIDRRELLQDTYSNVNHLNYIKTRLNDFVYAKSISSNAPFGVFKANLCKDGLLSTLYYTFKVKENADPLFLEYYFSDPYRANNFLRKYVLVGDRYITADSDYILSGKIKIPTLPEQQKIADYLSAIDTKIETVNQQIEKTQEFKRGLLQQMFV